MTTIERIAELPRPCPSSSHNPPSMIVLQPGAYRHTCPQCGMSQTFTVNGTTC